MKEKISAILNKLYIDTIELGNEFDPIEQHVIRNKKDVVEELVKIIEKPLVYLAVPYSHSEPEIKEWRFNQVNKMTAKLMKEGVVIFSPISHCHSIAKHNDLPTDWEFWRNFDIAYLSCSKKLLVYKLDGWETSIGVTNEIKIANELGIPIEYLEYEPILETKN